MNWRAMRHWIVAGLVFLSLSRILYWALKEIVFDLLTVPDPYNNVVQMAAMGVILLVSLVCTSLLVGREKS
ncbi:hypothetical protein [Paenibacillus tepidiphilus]|uniref:hypothetical protein n=1 Tax=Paenibacillus tepidiphilus TaxID=2608683 RepID=UPI00123917DE|nr:hypothetical protein [Paenibacillus tepidiphilus]